MAALGFSCGHGGCNAASPCTCCEGVKARAVSAEFYLTGPLSAVPAPIGLAYDTFRGKAVNIEAALKDDEANLLAKDAFLKNRSLEAAARKDYDSAKAFRTQFQATEGFMAAFRAAALTALEDAKAELTRATDEVFKDLVRADLVRTPAPTSTPDLDLLARVHALEAAAALVPGGAAPATPSPNAKQRKAAAKAEALAQAEAKKAAMLAAREAEAVEAKKAAATQAEADRAAEDVRKDLLRVKREDLLRAEDKARGDHG